jgi:hypothetical protein
VGVTPIQYHSAPPSLRAQYTNDIFRNRLPLPLSFSYVSTRSHAIRFQPKRSHTIKRLPFHKMSRHTSALGVRTTLCPSIPLLVHHHPVKTSLNLGLCEEHRAVYIQYGLRHPRAPTYTAPGKCRECRERQLTASQVAIISVIASHTFCASFPLSGRSCTMRKMI